MRQGAAVLERCRVDHCGHYGIGADGPGVLVDCRQTVRHSRARARARGWV